MIPVQQLTFPSLYKLFSGNGGNAGNVNIRYRTLKGGLKSKSCRGTGAQPANNGRGGEGKKSSDSFRLQCVVS